VDVTIDTVFSLASNLCVYRELSQQRFRLQMVADYTNLTVFNSDLLLRVSAIEHSLSRLNSALLDSSQAITTLNDLQLFAGYQDVTDHMHVLACSTKAHAHSMKRLVETLKPTPTLPVLLQG
jgi:hypothetical protein